MSHWHLTVGETAFAVPLGVIVGSLVSYVAVRSSTRATLEVQRAALADARAQAAAQRLEDLAREEREHRRRAYEDLGDLLQSVNDACNAIVGPVLMSTLDVVRGLERAPSGPSWGELHGEIAEAVRRGRRAAAVYGSEEVRSALGVLGALVRTLQPLAPFADASGYWMHALTLNDGAVATELVTLVEDQQVHAIMLENLNIFQPIVAYALEQIRHELSPNAASAPTRPSGLPDPAEDRDRT